MFHIVTYQNRHRYLRQLAAMHAHRPEMFEGRPGGGPEAAAGRLGRDRFDDRHASYVMGLDSWGEIECCVRLRPTSEGSIIGSYYQHGIDRAEPRHDASGVWEMSHYYARGGARGPAGFRIRAQLRLAMLAAACEAGVTRIVSVCETGIWPRAKGCGWSVRPLGAVFPFCDGGEALVYEIDSRPEALEAYRDWLDNDKAVSQVVREAGEVAAVAKRLGPQGLELVSSVTRRIAGIEELQGPEAAMALALKLRRGAAGVADA